MSDQAVIIDGDKNTNFIFSAFANVISVRVVVVVSILNSSTYTNMASNFKQRNPYFFSQSGEDDFFNTHTDESGKEKGRRRKGCGHPYRLRLNMEEDNHEQPSQQAPHYHQAGNQVNTYENKRYIKESTNPVKKQGRHPYRRSSRMEYEQGNQDRNPNYGSYNNHEQVSEEYDYDMLRLSADSQHELFASFEGHHENERNGNGYPHAEPRRQSRNLSPYNTRKNYHRQNETRGNTSFSNQRNDSWEVHQRQQARHGNLRNPQYGQRGNSNFDAQGNHYDAQQGNGLGEAPYPENGNGIRENDGGAKVIYKKRKIKGFFTRRSKDDTE